MAMPDSHEKRLPISTADDGYYEGLLVGWVESNGNNKCDQTDCLVWAR